MNSFRKLNCGFVLGNTVGLLLLFVQLGYADMVTALSPSEARQAPAVRNVTMRDDVVRGEIVNPLPDRVREVELLIRQIWHWNNEFRPGANPPGAAFYRTVTAEIPAGAIEPFTCELSPLPSRSDGYFETVVTVAGFTEIKPQREERRNIDPWMPISGWGSRDDGLAAANRGFRHWYPDAHD
jgi:hypothetical protein